MKYWFMRMKQGSKGKDFTKEMWRRRRAGILRGQHDDAGRTAGRSSTLPGGDETMTFVDEAMAMLDEVEDSGVKEILERDILLAEAIEESGDE